MALQTSGVISLDDIHVEAGGTTGTTVSLNDTDVRNLISSTPGTVVSFDDFYGASAVDVGIDNGALSDLQIAPATSSCSITFHTDGTISTTGNTTSYSDTHWHSPTTTNIGNDYRIKVISSNNTVTGPTLNIYHLLNSNRTWTLSKTSGLASSNLTVSLANNITSQVVSQASITMSVEST